MKANSATILNLGVGNLWMMLGVTDVDDLRETAKFFTGTLFQRRAHYDNEPKGLAIPTGTRGNVRSA